MNEDELLEKELNYRPPQRDTRLIKTHPPGYNVLSGISAFFLVGGFILGGLPVQLALGQNAGIPAILSGAVVGLLLAFTVPRKLWVGIGPTGRAMLRPFGCMGSFAIWMMCLVALAVVVNLGKFFAGGGSVAGAVALRGDNWQVICNPDRLGDARNLTLAEARRACAALGPEWRLPKAEDLGFVQANLTGLMWRSARFRLDEDGPNQRFFEYNPRQSSWGIVSTSSSDIPMQALCLKSASAVKAQKPPQN
ncbi:hypothetical protein JST97_10540 [bacterium]|nr:hypothetical protein [bacterium]